MKIRYLIPTLATATAIAFSYSTRAAQAAVIQGGGGANTCDRVDNNYFIDCAGYFDGNDKGAQGTGIDNLNSLFGGTWSFLRDAQAGTGKSGAVTDSSLSGAGAIAVKAGNSYSLYTVNDLGNFSWSTAGVKLVGPAGKKKAPDLSHLSIYTRTPDPKPVPEPGVLLSLVGVASIGTRLKRNKH